MGLGIRTRCIAGWRGRCGASFTIAETHEICATRGTAVPVRPERDHQFLKGASAMSTIVRPFSQFQAKAMGAFCDFQLRDEPHIDEEPMVAFIATKGILTGYHLRQLEKRMAVRTPQ